MTTENPFVLNKEDYKRDIHFIRDYVRDATNFLSTSTGKSPEECEAWIKKQLSKDGRFAFKDPEVTYLERNKYGDRVEKKTTLWAYLADTFQKNQLLAPTFTTYLSEKENKSVLVDFIDGNVKLRGIAKKAMFAAQMVGDRVLQAIKKIEQLCKKISNNSISGAHVSSSTPLYNKTAHATLTSNCRSTSGFGNANNEKFLLGNRHYWNAKITINNIVSIVYHTDYTALKQVVDKYQLHLPSVQETMDVILYSTNLYWRNNKSIYRISEYVSRLTPLQRAAFVYTGDLYHLAKYNDAVVRRFIDRLTTRVKGECENPSSLMKKYREEYEILARQFFPDEMRGKLMKEIKGQPVEQWIALTVKNIHDTLEDYRDFISVFFVTNNVPASLAFFPDSIRRCALTSDTDSTIFTVQDWTFWHRGPNADFGAESQATEATMIFLAAETITHILARMSANFGISSDRIHQVAMKNEYKFEIFTPTQVGKHYFALTGCQEGNLFKELEMEIKGVHLKNSAIPKHIIERAEKMMHDCMMTVVNGKKIRLIEILKEVADVERKIKNSILSGSSEYLKVLQINPEKSYKQGAESPAYQQYLFWEEVFAPKYGHSPVPPYTALKVNVELKSPTDVRLWINQIEDREIAARIQKWVTENQKTGFTSFSLPVQCLQVHGIPKEIAQILDIRKIVFGLVTPFYIVLETLGWYCVEKNNTKMCSDYY